MSAVDLRVRIEGDGAAVLLLHGFGDSLDSFWDSGWAGALSGRKVIAFDARGHGGSARPSGADAYEDPVRVADAVSVLDRAGVRRAHVLGYSMGGWTAMRLAIDAPERVASLLVGGAQPFGQSLEPLRRLLAGGVQAFIDALARARTLPPAARERFSSNDPAALEAIIARDREPLDTRSVRAPLFTWAGEHDPLSPLVERFAALHDGAFISVPQAGHFAAFDAPMVLRAASSWIAERS